MLLDPLSSDLNPLSAAVPEMETLDPAATSPLDLALEPKRGFEGSTDPNLSENSSTYFPQDQAILIEIAGDPDAWIAADGIEGSDRASVESDTAVDPLSGSSAAAVQASELEGDPLTNYFSTQSDRAPIYLIDPPPTTDNSIATARNLGTLNAPQNVTEFVGNADPNDFYRFQLTNDSQTSITLNGLTADADIQLIRDFNLNGFVDPGEVLGASLAPNHNPERIDARLTAGTYYLQVAQYRGDTNYNLGLNVTPIGDSAGNNLSFARDLGTLATPQTLNEWVSPSDPNDFYRFQLDGSRPLSVTLDGLSADADLQLIRDFNANGIVDTGEILDGSYGWNATPEGFQRSDLAPGTYYLQVTRYSGATGYNLSLLGDLYSSDYGYGRVDASVAVARTLGWSTPFPDVPNRNDANWGVDAVNAPDAWAQGFTGQGVTVAVIDSGVDYTHPDLAANIWQNPGEIAANGIDDDGNGFIDDVRGWDFVSSDADPMDVDGHGTHVAGTIAAPNNGVGVTGIAPNATIMPVRAIGSDNSSSGSLPSGSAFDLASSVRYATDNGADVINLSLGGEMPSDVLFDAVRYASDRGTTVVMASGNSGSATPNFPANYASQTGIAVGAVDRNNAIAPFSNRAGGWLDYVVAPGVDITSTTPNNTYQTFQGTSMAAPHVTGTAALVRSANPNLPPVWVERVITETANPYGIVV